MANKEIFFLGAGFSKAINNRFPLIKELSQNILGEELSSIENGKQLLKRVPSSCIEDFESLLTYLITDFPWKTEREKLVDKSTFIEITEKIHNYLLQAQAIADYNYAIFEPFWKYVLRVGNPIITLNYDTIVERNLDLFKSKTEINRIDGTIIDMCAYEPFYKGLVPDVLNNVRDELSLSEHMPEVLKLHGSINWYHAASNKTSSIYCANENDDTRKMMLGSYIPFIVPPILDKTSLYSNTTLQALWKKAYNYLKNASKINIIGFSFPKTDLSVKYLFESALKSNIYNPKIQIINTNTSDEYKQKCNNILGKNCNFTYCRQEALELFIKNEILPLEAINIEP